MARRRRRSARPVGPHEVRVLYDRLLGREPLAHEVAAQSSAPTLEALLDTILASQEYRQRVAGNISPSADLRAAVATIWTPELDPFGPPPGTVSPDGVAEVGREGVLFIRGGANDNRRQYAGDFDLPDGWGEAWRTAIELRESKAGDLGIETLWLAVPDKLACDGRLLAEPLAEGRRPLQRLIAEVGAPLLYPADRLTALPERAYLRTDSHLSLAGNRELAAAVLEAFDAPPPPMVAALHPVATLGAGDLGRHFDPPLAEVLQQVKGWPVSVIHDNHPEIFALGGHLGTRVVVENPAAPDPRTCVLFGDSYGFATAGYQGLLWWLGLAFREVHFIWLPFGWDTEYLERVNPEVVIVQGAERFCVRAPAPDTDTTALTERTIRMKRGLDLSEIEH